VITTFDRSTGCYLRAMCSDWLCVRGNNGFCYFTIDPSRIAHRSRDLVEDDWDALDQLHDQVIADQQSQRAASALGIELHFRGHEATSFDKQLGAKRFLEVKSPTGGLHERSSS
jgi:hypothetical protein